MNKGEFNCFMVKETSPGWAPPFCRFHLWSNLSCRLVCVTASALLSLSSVFTGKLFHSLSSLIDVRRPPLSLSRCLSLALSLSRCLSCTLSLSTPPTKFAKNKKTGSEPTTFHTHYGCACLLTVTKRDSKMNVPERNTAFNKHLITF